MLENKLTENSDRSSGTKSLKRAGWVCAAVAASLLACSALGGFVATSAPAHAELRVMDQPVQGMPSLANLIDKVKPAVVSVRVKVQNASTSDDEDGMSQIPPQIRKFFKQFGDSQQNGPQRPGRGERPLQQAQGSGFFISADGYLVTNNHVVENAASVQVVLDGGDTMDAKVIGTDPKTDLALLKVEGGKDLPFVRMAKDKPRIGDWVVAVGNPFGLGGTVTSGIVSALHRDIGQGPYDDFLQIDASVNRGNSGGPTFNLAGEVVGVNTAIFSPSGGSVGIVFAIPSSTVDRVVGDLREKGSVSRGLVDVQIQPVTKEIAEAIGLKEPKGTLVAEAVASVPAAKAGIRTGDTITAVNGEPVSEPKDLSKKIAAVSPGQSVAVTVYRAGKEREVKIEVERQPNGA